MKDNTEIFKDFHPRKKYGPQIRTQLLLASSDIQVSEPIPPFWEFLGAVNNSVLTSLWDGVIDDAEKRGIFIYERYTVHGETCPKSCCSSRVGEKRSYSKHANDRNNNKEKPLKKRGRPKTYSHLGEQS